MAALIYPPKKEFLMARRRPKARATGSRRAARNAPAAREQEPQEEQQPQKKSDRLVKEAPPKKAAEK